jgi:hypothetical protein
MAVRLRRVILALLLLLLPLPFSPVHAWPDTAAEQPRPAHDWTRSLPTGDPRRKDHDPGSEVTKARRLCYRTGLAALCIGL